MSSIVQYILLRTDLKLGAGASMAQVAHASVAAIARTYDAPATREYLGALESMTKVVLKCEDEGAMRSVADALSKESIAHHLWIEQPENVPTCLATAPAPRDQLKPFFAAFKLLR